jgi:hypothetical protein
MTRTNRGIVAGFWAAGACAVALGYQDEGHLFTSAVVVYTAVDPQAGDAAEPLLRPDVARMVALCTQLPDQSLEYDAVQVVNHHVHIGTAQSKAWLQWVQEDLHALTGGNVQTMRQCASQVVDLAHSFVRSSNGQDWARVCALGFAIHLLGDSWAHFGFDGKGTLYSSPLGHFADYHEPDLPFYDAPERVPNWLGYVGALRAALDLSPCGPGTATEVCRALEDAADAGAQTFSANPLERHGFLHDLFSNPVKPDEEPNQKKVRDAVVAALTAHGRGPPQGFPSLVPDAPGGFASQNLACDDYVKAASQVDGGFRPPPFRCAEVWTDFAQVAGDILTTPSCEKAFSDDGDWQTSRPTGGYSDE